MLIDYFLLLVNNKLQNYPFSQHMFVDNRNKRSFIYSQNFQELQNFILNR